MTDLQHPAPAPPAKRARAAGGVRLGDQLYEKILQRIVSGDFPEGGRLPSESGLCDIYGVSRPVIREVLSRLQGDGLIVSRQGSGSYVQRRPGTDLLDLAPSGGVASMMRCFEVRMALESEAAGLAALRRTDDDIAAINEANDTLERVILDGEVAGEADRQFHVAILTATRNQLFLSSFRAIAAPIFQGLMLAGRLSLKRNRARAELVLAEHRAIAAAIIAEDEDTARTAMRAHLANSKNRVLAASIEP